MKQRVWPPTFGQTSHLMKQWVWPPTFGQTSPTSWIQVELHQCVSCWYLFTEDFQQTPLPFGGEVKPHSYRMQFLFVLISSHLFLLMGTCMWVGGGSGRRGQTNIWSLIHVQRYCSPNCMASVISTCGLLFNGHTQSCCYLCKCDGWWHCFITCVAHQELFLPFINSINLFHKSACLVWLCEDVSVRKQVINTCAVLVLLLVKMYVKLTCYSSHFVGLPCLIVLRVHELLVYFNLLCNSEPKLPYMGNKISYRILNW